MSRYLIIYTAYNRPGKHDADGAFIPEALHAAGRLLEDGGVVDMLPLERASASARRRRVETWLLEYDHDLDAVVVFGHGTRRRLLATGHGSLRRDIDPLAAALRGALRPGGRVVLNCCLTASGEEGFADRLAQRLDALDWQTYSPLRRRVIAHTTAGHTAWNPYAEWAGEGSQGVGLPVISRLSKWWPEWVRRLREDQRFRSTWWKMSESELIGELAGDAVLPASPAAEHCKNQV